MLKYKKPIPQNHMHIFQKAQYQILSQKIFLCSKSTIESPEKGVKYVQS